MTSRAQRWGPRGTRSLVNPTRTVLPTEADSCANVYACRYHGEITLREEIVLAANEEQAKQQAILRWKFLGQTLGEHPTISVEKRPWANVSRGAILTFESAEEFQARQDFHARGDAA